MLNPGPTATGPPADLSTMSMTMTAIQRQRADDAAAAADDDDDDS